VRDPGDPAVSKTKQGIRVARKHIRVLSQCGIEATRGGDPYLGKCERIGPRRGGAFCNLETTLVTPTPGPELYPCRRDRAGYADLGDHRRRAPLVGRVVNRGKGGVTDRTDARAGLVSQQGTMVTAREAALGEGAQERGQCLAGLPMFFQCTPQRPGSSVRDRWRIEHCNGSHSAGLGRQPPSPTASRVRFRRSARSRSGPRRGTSNATRPEALRRAPARPRIRAMPDASPASAAAETRWVSEGWLRCPRSQRSRAPSPELRQGGRGSVRSGARWCLCPNRPLLSWCSAEVLSPLNSAPARHAHVAPDTLPLRASAWRALTPFKGLRTSAEQH